MGYWSNAFIRIKPFNKALQRWRHDCRYIPYDLMPFIATPRARNFIAALIAFFSKKTSNVQLSKQAELIYNELTREGISLSLPPLEQSKVEAVTAYFKHELCHDPYRPHLGLFPWDKPASEETNMGYYSFEQILKAPYLLDIFQDKDILAVAEKYLGCKPILDNIGVWWSYEERPQAKGTQRFHRDLDSYKGFKQFLYLTPVDEDSGPHVYLKETHRSAICASGEAQEDQKIYDIVPKNKEICVVGSAGKRFIADTFGFHKGLLPKKTKRLLVAIQYNVNRSPHNPSNY